MSGLANLDVDGGGITDASPDVTAPSDAADEGDSGSVVEIDAGRALTALKTVGSCTKTQTNVLPLSGESFAIELWLRIDAFLQQQGGVAVLWKGGQTASTPGWSLLLQTSSIAFCVADGQTQACTPPAALPAQHLVHIGISSAVVNSSRTIELYARDVTAGDTKHALLGSVGQAPATWAAPTTPFAIGGMAGSLLCTNMASVTVDDVRIFTNTALSSGVFDQNESVDISCTTTNLSADYKLNDGNGTTAVDCANKFDLTLGANASLVPSPFP